MNTRTLRLASLVPWVIAIQLLHPSPTRAQSAPPSSRAEFSYQIALQDDNDLKLEGNNVTVFDNGRKGLILATYRGQRGLYVLRRNASKGFFNRQSIQPAPDNIQGAWVKTPAISPDGKHLAQVVNDGGVEKLVAITNSSGISLDFQDPKFLLNTGASIPSPTGTFRVVRFSGDAAFTPDSTLLFNFVYGGSAATTFKYEWNSSAKDYDNLGRYSGSGFGDLKYYRPGDTKRGEQGSQNWSHSIGTPQTDGVEMLNVVDSLSRGLKLISMKFLSQMPERIPGGQWLLSTMTERDPVTWAGSVSPIGSFYQGPIKNGDGSYAVIVWRRGAPS